MYFTITAIDHAPEELYAQIPIHGKLLRQIAGPDRPDYYIVEIDRPIKWKNDSNGKSIKYLVLTARWAGGVLSSTMVDTPVNIAYVTDESVISDPKLDFKKCFYAAIGTASGNQ